MKAVADRSHPHFLIVKAPLAALRRISIRDRAAGRAIP